MSPKHILDLLCAKDKYQLVFIAGEWVVALLNRASRSFTYPLLGPLFFRTSSYEQS